jgi:putative FmdB family regulatory protein
MPIYEYVPDGGSCARCVGRFEVLQSLSAPELLACPDCGQPCHRVISAAAVVAGSAHRLSEKHAGKHGFTQYRKVGKGKYEKTFGKGPGNIEG